MRMTNDSAFADVLPFTRDDLAEPFATNYAGVFNWTANDYKNMIFDDNERYSDIAFSEVFEGYNTYNFTDSEWHDVVLQLDAALLDPYEGRARLLKVTAEARGMLKDMNNLLMNNVDGVPQYRLYSAHDSNIANWLKQLVPSYKWFGIPYAANIFFEFYQSTQGGQFVQMLYNGTPIVMEGCLNEMCSIPRFFAHM